MIAKTNNLKTGRREKKSRDLVKGQSDNYVLSLALKTSTEVICLKDDGSLFQAVGP